MVQFVTPSRVITSLFTLLSICVGPSYADGFTTPPGSVNDLVTHYTVGQSVEVTWNTSLSTINLFLCHWGAERVAELLLNEDNTGSYNWTVGLNDNVDDAEISSSQNFVFVIEDPDGNTTGNGFVDGDLSSRAFIIKSNDTTTTTSSTSSATATATRTSATQTATSTASDGSSGLSTGAKAGIGIGVACAGLIIIVVCFNLFRRLRPKPNPAELASALTPNEFLPTDGPDAMIGAEKSLQHSQQPFLLSNDTQRVGELPAGLWSGGITPVQELALPVHELDGRTSQ